MPFYVYPSGHNGILLVVDSKGNFREENFLVALDVLNEQLKEINKFQIYSDRQVNFCASV